MIQEPEEIALNTLLGEVYRIRAQVPGSRWFLFGSITTARRPVGDIDLLVVCEKNHDCELVRSELWLVSSQWPIHLLLMTVSEEAEVNFKDGQRAVEIVDAKLGMMGPNRAILRPE
jgi:hypothetical protein